MKSRFTWRQPEQWVVRDHRAAAGRVGEVAPVGCSSSIQQHPWPRLGVLLRLPWRTKQRRQRQRPIAAVGTQLHTQLLDRARKQLAARRIARRVDPWHLPAHDQVAREQLLVVQMGERGRDCGVRDRGPLAQRRQDLPSRSWVAGPEALYLPATLPRT